MTRTNHLSTVKKAIAIILSANTFNTIFCLSVIVLLVTNPSKCFLYISVPLNQTANFSEPFTKQYDANKSNGVVGITGKMIPSIPTPKLKKPAQMNNNFVSFLIRSPSKTSLIQLL